MKDTSFESFDCLYQVLSFNFPSFRVIYFTVTKGYCCSHEIRVEVKFRTFGPSYIVFSFKTFSKL